MGMVVAPCFKETLASEFAQCQVSGQMSGKMRYSLQTWPRRAARAGGPPRVPGVPAGGRRPRVRPQPPAVSPGTLGQPAWFAPIAWTGTSRSQVGIPPGCPHILSISALRQSSRFIQFNDWDILFGFLRWIIPIVLHNVSGP